MKIGPHAYDLDPNEAKRRMVEESFHNAIHRLEAEITQLKAEFETEIKNIYNILDEFQK